MRRPAWAAVLLVALLACAHAAHAADEVDAVADEIAAALEAEAVAEAKAEPQATLGDVFEPTSLPEGADTQAASEGAVARAEAAPTCGNEAECLAACPRDNVLSSDATDKVVQEQVRGRGRRGAGSKWGKPCARDGPATCGERRGHTATASDAPNAPVGRAHKLIQLMAGVWCWCRGGG